MEGAPGDTILIAGTMVAGTMVAGTIVVLGTMVVAGTMVVVGIMSVRSGAMVAAGTWTRLLGRAIIQMHKPQITARITTPRSILGFIVVLHTRFFFCHRRSGAKTLQNFQPHGQTGMDDALACAVQQALKSPETFRHGAVLLRGSRVLAAGRNRNLNSCGLSSIHAEMDAAWKVRGSRKTPTHCLVVRLRRDQQFAYSRPCGACRRALLHMGVRRMTYTTGDPAAPLVTEDLRDSP